MAIDPSIAVGQAPQNPMQFMQGLTALKGQQLQQNQLTQQMNANTATSRAMQQAYDPATGQVDNNKLFGLLAQDPDGGYNLPTIRNQVLQGALTQSSLDTGNFERAQKQNNFFVNQLGGLASKDNPKYADVLNIAANAIGENHVPPDIAVQALKNVPQDPAGIKQWAQQNLRQSMINSGQYAGVLPQNSQINTGPNTQFVSTDPITGRPSVQGQLQNGMAPGDANSMVQVYDPASQSMRMVTKTQAAQMANGGGQPQQGGYQPDTSGGSLGTGRLQPMAPAGQQPQGIQAGPALGAADAAAVLGRGQGDAVLALQHQSDSAQQAVYQFQNMRSALADINTGPGSDMRNTAAAFATMISPDIAARFGADPQKIASQEEFHKFATQATQATLAGLGNGTDSMLASAVSANPNTQLSKLGNQQILDVLQAGQQAIMAKNQAWQNSGLPPEQFNKFSTQWTKDVDPRIFAAQNMDNASVQKMVHSLSPKDQAAFANSWMKAQQAGYVK